MIRFILAYILIGACFVALLIALGGCSVRFPNGTALAVGEPLLTERAALSGGSFLAPNQDGITLPSVKSRALALCPLFARHLQAQCLVSQL